MIQKFKEAGYNIVNFEEKADIYIVNTCTVTNISDRKSRQILRRAKALVPVLVPLFISSFRRADELATAMECRCYRGGEGRTRMNVLKASATDVLWTLALVLLGAAVVFINRTATGFAIGW